MKFINGQAHGVLNFTVQGRVAPIKAQPTQFLICQNSFAVSDTTLAVDI